MKNTFLTPQGAFNLRTRFALVFIFISVVMSIILSTSVGYYINQKATEQAKTRVLALVKLASQKLNGDIHSTLNLENQSSDMEKSEYKAIQSQMLLFMKSDPTITSIYTLKQKDGKLRIGVNVISDQSENTSAKLGDQFNASTILLQGIAAPQKQAVVENEIRTDVSGSSLSAYAPFYRADGNLEGWVGVDIDGQEILYTRNESFLVLAGIMLLLALFQTGFGWWLGGRIAEPVSEMTEMANLISDGKYQTAIIPITSSDEIGEFSRSFHIMADKIRIAVHDLELRIQEKTTELEKQSEQLSSYLDKEAKRVTQLQTIAQVGRLITSIRDIDDPLPRITEIIGNQFGFYHVGIFLLNDDGQYSVLRATNSLGGKRMLEKNYRVRVGESGLVAYVANTGNPRIALDTGQGAVFFNNPDLPETRSEVALPLRTGSQVIGVLDVHSTQAAAFGENDIELLSILADQVSVSIQNARLFEETNKSLAEAEGFYLQYLRGEWKRAMKNSINAGYRYSLTGAQPIVKPILTEEIQHVLQSGNLELSAKSSEMSHIVVPIKLRNEVIGVIRIKSYEKRSWSEDEVDIASSIASRIAIAAENARLLNESQKRANKERTISQIAAKIGGSTSMETILETAVQELGKILPVSDVIIHMRPEES